MGNLAKTRRADTLGYSWILLDNAGYKEGGMALRPEYKKALDDILKLKEGLSRMVYDSVLTAADEMVAKAKEVTPASDDTGVNTQKGHLSDHWEHLTTRERDGVKSILCNPVEYASYVDEGHKMTPHFVPWLYIDDTGCISRHDPKDDEALFGLMVGTKTSQVEPENITKQATERFESVLEKEIERLSKEI